MTHLDTTKNQRPFNKIKCPHPASNFFGWVMQSPISRPENFLWREWWSNCLQPRRYTLSQHVETIANLSDAGVSWCQLERPGHKPWRNAKLIQHRVEKHFLGEILTGRKHESFSPIRRTIWVNYNISLTWIVRPFGDDVPLLTMIPGLGRSEVVIKFTQNHVIEKSHDFDNPPSSTGTQKDHLWWKSHVWKPRLQQ